MSIVNLRCTNPPPDPWVEGEGTTIDTGKGTDRGCGGGCGLFFAVVILKIYE